MCSPTTALLVRICCLCAEAPLCRWWYTFMGFDATQKTVLKKYGEAYRIMFQDAAAIVAVSVDMKQQLMTLGAAEEKIALIPYGIDVKKFRPEYEKKTK